MLTDDTAVAARPPFGKAVVRGPSMTPTLREGDRLLVRYGVPVRPGDVVVARHPLQQDLLLVKRAVGRRDGGWWLLGDNPYSEGDSRLFGAVPGELVLARAVARYRPRRGYTSRVAWVLGSLRPVTAGRSLSRRLRAR